MTMQSDELLDRFTAQAPLPVMVRGTMQHVLSPAWLDALFEMHAEQQYEHELLFSTVIELMSAVGLGRRPSLCAAYRAVAERVPVSLTAVYGKVNRTDLGLIGALVRESATRMSALIDAMPPTSTELPLETGGYAVRIVDGNHLAATEKRIKPLRGFRGAALPGHALVVYDPVRRLAVDLLPCEDAHAQERTLFDTLLTRVSPGELWVADRNFSVARLMVGIAERKAAFVIRQHGASPAVEALTPLESLGRIETGEVFEQRVRIHGEHGATMPVRRIELHLDAPTEDGATQIAVLTNATVARLDGCAVMVLYRERWRIEGAFGELDAAMHAEVRSLGQPRAALLAFALGVVGINVLNVVRGALRAKHGDKADDTHVSTYLMAVEIRARYDGMMVALPPERWQDFGTLNHRSMARVLLNAAGHVSLRSIVKSPRGPKVKKAKGYVASKIAASHVSTARVLDGQRMIKGLEAALGR